MGKRQYSSATLKSLFARSGNLYAAPECVQRVTLELSTGGVCSIGDNAHIRAFSDKGPRGTAWQPDEDQNSVNNLILLCPTHHRMIDADPERYPVEVLRHWKAVHEEKVLEATLEAKRQTDPSLLIELEPHLEFDYRKPGDYRRWARLSSQERLIERLQTALRLKTCDPEVLFRLTMMASDYLSCIGENGTMRLLLEQCMELHPLVFRDEDAVGAQDAERSILHTYYGREDAHQREVDFCISKLGHEDDRTIRSLMCQACVLMLREELQAAEDVLSGAERLYQQKRDLAPDITIYLHLHFGKLFTRRASRSLQPDRHIFAERALDHLQHAEFLMESDTNDHVTLAFLFFFLWKASTIAHHENDARYYHKLASVSFSHASYPGMFHYPDRDLRRELGIGS